MADSDFGLLLVRGGLTFIMLNFIENWLGYFGNSSGWDNGFRRSV